jgi:hypothetical protein
MDEEDEDEEADESQPSESTAFEGGNSEILKNLLSHE